MLIDYRKSIGAHRKTDLHMELLKIDNQQLKFNYNKKKKEITHKTNTKIINFNFIHINYSKKLYRKKTQNMFEMHENNDVFNFGKW